MTIFPGRGLGASERGARCLGRRVACRSSSTSRAAGRWSLQLFAEEAWFTVRRIVELCHAGAWRDRPLQVAYDDALALGRSPSGLHLERAHGRSLAALGGRAVVREHRSRNDHRSSGKGSARAADSPGPQPRARVSRDGGRSDLPRRRASRDDPAGRHGDTARVSVSGCAAFFGPSPSPSSRDRRVVGSSGRRVVGSSGRAMRVKDDHAARRERSHSIALRRSPHSSGRAR